MYKGLTLSPQMDLILFQIILDKLKSKPVGHATGPKKPSLSDLDQKG